MPDFASFTTPDWVDLLLMLAGGIVLLVEIVRHFLRHRDPLLGSPLRASVLSASWVWLALLAYFGSAIIGNSLAPLYAAEGSSKNLAEWQTILAGNIHQIVVIVAMIAIASHTFTGRLRGYGICRQGLARDLRDALPLLLVALCVCNLLGWGMETAFRTLAPKFEIPPHPVFTTLAMPETPWFIRINAILGAILLAPVGEELLFRGILQTAFHKIFPARHHSLYHRWAAIACVATIFGLLHLATPQHVPALILLGVLLGYLYEKTGSILAPIYLHVLFNSKSVLWFYLGTT